MCFAIYLMRWVASVADAQVIGSGARSGALVSVAAVGALLGVALCLERPHRTVEVPLVRRHDRRIAPCG